MKHINAKTIIIIIIISSNIVTKNKQTDKRTREKKIKSVLKKKFADIFYVKVRDVCLWLIWAQSTEMTEQRRKHSLNAI